MTTPRFLVDSTITKVVNATTIDVVAPAGLADGDDVWIAILWTHPANSGNTIAAPGVSKWRSPVTMGGTYTTSSGGNTSRLNTTVFRANTGISDFGGAYAVADQGAGPWTFTTSAAGHMIAVAFAFRGHSSAQSSLNREGAVWPSNTASVSGIGTGGFSGTPVYEENYIVAIAGYNTTDDPTITFVDDDNTAALLEDDTTDDATTTLRRLHLKAWRYGDANALQLNTDAPSVTFASTSTGSTTFTARRGQYAVFGIGLGTLVPGFTPDEDPPVTLDLRLVKVKESEPPYNVPTGMLDARQR